MKITKKDLSDHGIDPSLYTSEDMSEIEKNADIIKNGELSAILDQISLHAPQENELKGLIIESRESVIDCIRELVSLLDEIYELCSPNQVFFSSSISPEDKDRIVAESARLLDEMFEAKDRALDYVTLMFNYKTSLSDIRHEYNTKLYKAGMLNAAFSVVCPEEDNSDIINAIGAAFEMFNELTEIANDVNDRVIIFDEALNQKLPKAWYDMTTHLDLDNDGAQLSLQKVKSTIDATKLMLKDVIER